MCLPNVTIGGVQSVLEACFENFEFLISRLCPLAQPTPRIPLCSLCLLLSLEPTHAHITMTEQRSSATVETPSASKRGRGANKTVGGEPAKKASSKKAKPSPSSNNETKKKEEAGTTKKATACKNTPAQQPRARTLDAWIVRDSPIPARRRSALRSLSPDAAVIKEGLLPATSPPNSSKSREEQVGWSEAASLCAPLSYCCSMYESCARCVSLVFWLDGAA